jgi:hypothetical protein
VWSAAQVGGFEAGGYAWSSNGGATWTPSSQLFGQLGGMSFPDSNTGYFVGDNGAIIKWTGAASGVQSRGSVANQYLDIIAYPVPAQDEVNCGLYGIYSLTDKSAIRFIIYDLLGRQVLDLSGEALVHSNGAYSLFTFSTKTLPAGSYIMAYITSNGSTSKRFIVMK